MESYVNEKHSSEYLYGVTSLEGIIGMPYYKAIVYKIAMAMLTKISIANGSAIDIDTYRVVAINKAIDFNKVLLSEVGLSNEDIEEVLGEVFVDVKTYGLHTILESHNKGDKC